MVPQVDLCYHWIQQLVVDAQLDGIFGATAPMSLGLKDLISNGYRLYIMMVFRVNHPEIRRLRASGAIFDVTGTRACSRS